MEEKLESRYNSILVSGRADGVLTYSKYVKNLENGKSVAEELNERIKKSDELDGERIKDASVTPDKLSSSTFAAITAKTDARYLPLTGGTIYDSSLTITKNEPPYKQVVITEGVVRVSDGREAQTTLLTQRGIIYYDTDVHSSTVIDKEGLAIQNGHVSLQGDSCNATITSNAINMADSSDSESYDEIDIATNRIIISNRDGHNYYKSISIGYDGIELTSGDEGQVRPSTVINETAVYANKFVMNDGTSKDVLLADGSTTKLATKNGIPTLDENGFIPLSQLGNTDTNLFVYVSELPTTDIKKNKIYLIKQSGKDFASAYVYLGDVDHYEPSKWESIGSFSSNVDIEAINASINDAKTTAINANSLASEANSTAEANSKTIEQHTEKLTEQSKTLANVQQKVENLDVPKVVYMTQAAYDALTEKDPNTTYLTTEE